MHQHQLAAYLHQMDKGVRDVGERHALWLQIAPNVKSMLASIVYNVNTVAANSGKTRFVLSVREQSSHPDDRLHDIGVVLSDVSTGLSVSTSNTKSREDVVERGAELWFIPSMNGLITVIMVRAQVVTPGAPLARRSEDTLGNVGPAELNNHDRVLDFLGTFLATAARLHWTTE